MLKVGVDSTKFRGIADESACGMLEAAAEHGLDGVFFRSMFDLSSSLDAVELAEVAARAHDLGLRLESGIGKVNPFSTPESPAIRALGGGDYLHGMRRMVEAASAIGVRELWSATANYQFRFRGLYACDRFRTDVSWDEQLEATEYFLHALAPILRDNDVHLNLETHEEITTFELVRLVESVGPDVLGITFDSANVLVRCEDPIEAVRRAAPYIRSTHIRDAALFRRSESIARLLQPVGAGVIDWEQLLAPLIGKDLMLSIEGVLSSFARMDLHIDDPRWIHCHPDLTDAERETVVGLVEEHERRVHAGHAEDWEALSRTVDERESLAFVLGSAETLRETIARLESSMNL